MMLNHILPLVGMAIASLATAWALFVRAEV
jgi:hypothetical protein